MLNKSQEPLNPWLNRLTPGTKFRPIVQCQGLTGTQN